MEALRKTEVQLELMIKLATLVMEYLNNSLSSTQKEEVLAITLRSGRQLEKSSPDYHQVPSETSEGKDDQHAKEKIQDTPEAVVTAPDKITTEEGRPTTLPYPTSTRKKQRAKTIDPQIVELLQKVEVTLPLLEVIRQASPEIDFKVSAVRIPRLPRKYGDPGPYMVDCAIGEVLLNDYKSITTVAGKAEDVLLRIGELVFPVDFDVRRSFHKLNKISQHSDK
ncbi:hypothetical protein PIB30_077966 [Stylosanthes scabra]|uniref:Uncharacterized protein n=1 Tax=Stylosanthes scabra TaxID=79078 RepID=A0ABU6RQQ5_9FABA|nr:hypothetical protein [Stylosanthes scabra]